MGRTTHWPPLPAQHHETDLPHPSHLLGRECTADEIEAYARHVGDVEGWDLVLPIRMARRPGRWLRVRYERREAAVGAPWSASELRDELALCGGDWQAVAAVLGVSYRELRRWLDSDAFRELHPLWRDERRRISDRESGGEGRPGDDPLKPSPDALRKRLAGERGPVAVVRLLELYVDAVEDGREVPAGIREYLRRAGWIA